MAGLPMPGEDRLPPGPLRELTAAVYALYQLAGNPGTRRISQAIRTRNDLNDTVSHEAVRGILQGTHSSWFKVEALVMQLATWAVSKPNPKEETERIQVLWHAAQEARPGPISSRAAAPKFGRGSGIAIGADLAVADEGTTSVVVATTDPASRLQELLKHPLISWNPRTGTVDVYDRQVAMQMIKDMRASND
jgi:hypothetical protein